MPDYRLTLGPFRTFPNYVYKSSSTGKMCKAWDFRSYIARPLTLYTFLETAFVKIVALSASGLPVPRVLSISFWNFAMVDEFIEEMEEGDMG
ncbi:hypothetical protein TrRE_jg6455, partial [Triparma retinervis]